MSTSKISKILLIFIAISGCFSVLFGAWLAHADNAMTAVALTRVKVAHQYQFLHTLALFMVVIWYRYEPNKVLLFSAICFLMGILLFSGSLYIKSILTFSFFSSVTPFGGIALASGWLLLIFVGKNKL